MGARQWKKCQGEKRSEAIIKKKKQKKTENRRQRKKVNDSQIKIPKGHKNQTRTTNVFFFLIREIYSIVCRKSLFKAFCCMNKLQGCFK